MEVMLCKRESICLASRKMLVQGRPGPPIKKKLPGRELKGAEVQGGCDGVREQTGKNMVKQRVLCEISKC